MAYTIPKAAVIPYPPQKLHEFKLIWFEYVDNLHFGLNPAGFVDNAEPYLDIARQRFLEAGWAGDGEISLMWISPFAINDIDGTGICGRIRTASSCGMSNSSPTVFRGFCIRPKKSI